MRKKNYFPFFGKSLSFIARFLGCVFFIVLFNSCASTKDFSAVDFHAYSGDFTNATLQLDSEKEILYENTDQVLYGLDKGLLHHYAKDYEASNLALSEAEKLIEEYFAVSVMQTIGSYVINDNVTDYAGEDFEDIYTNLFMALNYIQLGDIESAFVEIRRFNNKLNLLSSKYAEVLQSAKMEALAQGYSEQDLIYSAQADNTLEFYDSAFARYVSLLLYRSINRMDSAEIDKKLIEKAFVTQTQLYPFSVPSAVYEEFNIPNEKVRLNVFCYAGTAPEKYEEVSRIPGIVTESWYKLALPVMYKKSSRVSRIEIKAIGQDKKIQDGNLEIIESLENIAIDTFKQKQGLIYLKTIMRSLSKLVANEGVTAVVAEAGGEMVASIFNFLGNIIMETTEQADIRSARYFPANVWIGGLNLEEGEYDIMVKCYDVYNNVIHEQIDQNVLIKKNNVNLVEVVCLQ